MFIGSPMFSFLQQKRCTRGRFYFLFVEVTDSRKLRTGRDVVDYLSEALQVTSEVNARRLQKMVELSQGQHCSIADTFIEARVFYCSLPRASITKYHI